MAKIWTEERRKRLDSLQEKREQQAGRVASAMERLVKLLEDKEQQQHLLSIPEFREEAYSCVILMGGGTQAEVKYAMMPTIVDLISATCRRPGTDKVTVYIARVKE